VHGAFLQDLAVVMLVAGVVTIIFHQLRQPVVLGYIVAGLIVGPHTSIPLGVHDRATIEIMSELGIILLMFGLGLHFSMRKLAKVGMTAVMGAGLELAVMLLAGYWIGLAFGWSRMDSIFLGAMLAMSSTTIIIKALEGLGHLHEKYADLTFGILIVEDIVGIAIIALLPAAAKTGSLPPLAVLGTLWGLGVFLASVLVLGLLTVPWLLRYVSRFKNDEMLLITALGLCFGVSLLALKLGYSVALGAFLIGAIIAEARERGKVEGLVIPVRDMFSAVFFVTIGMMIDPRMLITYAVPIAIITVVVVVGKIFSCTLGTFLAGNDGRTSLHVGMAVSQIGEFSFIIASVGVALGVTSDFLYPIAVTVSGITTLSTPYLIQASDGVIHLWERLVPRSVQHYLGTYSAWLSRRGAENGQNGQIRRLLRRWTLQIGLHVVLVTGLFVAAAAMARRLDGTFAHWPAWTGGTNTLLWLAAMLAAMPLLIVTVRKLRAIAKVTAEASVSPAAAGEQTRAIRGVVSGTIRVAGGTAMVLWLLLLSAAILPPWPILIALLAALILAVIFRWRTFETVYARAQLSLRETMTRPPELPPPPSRVLPTVLNGADLETVQIGAASPANGKLIRELELRSRTGASAVGIERNGASIVNPGPDEEIQAGDKVLLLGSRAQLEAAVALFTQGAEIFQ
jgi:CPA2 family monovalent cation:H+ antiporter-2